MIRSILAFLSLFHSALTGCPGPGCEFNVPVLVHKACRLGRLVVW